MSFSEDVKKELCLSYPEKKCCREAFFNASVAFFNKISFGRIRAYTEKDFVAEYYNKFFKELGFDSSFSFKAEEGLYSYSLNCNDGTTVRKVLEEAKMLDRSGNLSEDINGNLSVNYCCMREAVKGAFIVAGAMSEPTKNYHFEITNRYEQPLHSINQILICSDIESKVINRGKEFVLYIKDKETIADVLNFMGLKEMFFKYLDITVEKELKNKLNRKQNFESANENKVINASVDQRRAIDRLERAGKFEELPDPVREIALLRMEYPEASLTELAKMVNPPITRSGVNHRLKKILEAAESLNDKEKK